MSILLRICCGLLLASSAGGCGRFKRPATVVQSLYLDCNNGEYPKARFLFKSDLRDEFDGALNSNGPGIKGACDRLTKGGTMSNVEIAAESVHGEKASVYANVRFTDDSERRAQRTDLIQEDGVWKVSNLQ
jgi:hypothetical protein